jgi:hypothetical protein
MRIVGDLSMERLRVWYSGRDGWMDGGCRLVSSTGYVPEPAYLVEQGLREEVEQGRLE